ncbi:hypothetical protein ACHAWF_008173 [Thalassiosira exigua]
MEGESSVPKDDGPWPRRLLQDAAAAAGDEGGNDASSAPPRLTQTELLRSTCVVYLSVAALLLLLYFLVRPRFPKVYNLKRSYPSLRSSLAENAHGIASWTRRIFDVDDDALRDRCGMDALTTLRILRLGIKLSSVGTATSAFLIPAYFFAGGGDPNDEDAEYDPVRATSLSNLPPGHPASIATTFAAYVLFGSGMLFLAGDFEWFFRHRRKHLSEKRAENYTVFLAGVPSDLRTEEALRRIFDGFPPDAVADVAVALEIPELEGKAKRREEMLPKLQHAMNVLAVQGEMPTHKTKRCGGETVDSVSTYGDEVRRLNEEIDVHRARIELLSRVRRGARRASDAAEGDDDADDDDDDDAKEDTDDAKEERALDDAASSGLAGFRDALSAAYGASRDGTPRSAAFASFRTLTSATLARGAFAGTRPWECVAYDAPAPDRVNWKNVGKSNLSKQGEREIPFQCAIHGTLLSSSSQLPSILSSLFLSLVPTSCTCSGGAPGPRPDRPPVPLLDRPRVLRRVPLQRRRVDGVTALPRGTGREVLVVRGAPGPLGAVDPRGLRVPAPDDRVVDRQVGRTRRGRDVLSPVAVSEVGVVHVGPDVPRLHHRIDSVLIASRHTEEPVVRGDAPRRGPARPIGLLRPNRRRPELDPPGPRAPARLAHNPKRPAQGRVEGFGARPHPRGAKRDLPRPPRAGRSPRIPLRTGAREQDDAGLRRALRVRVHGPDDVLLRVARLRTPRRGVSQPVRLRVPPLQRFGGEALARLREARHHLHDRGGSDPLRRPRSYGRVHCGRADGPPDRRDDPL